jgi:hypothetical protein
MSEFLFEAAKTIGSLSGIFATGFLIWDRVIKHFPLAIVVARPLIEGSQQIVPAMYIKNVSDRPILISWDGGNSNQLRVAKDQSMNGIVRSMVRGRTVISLGPAGEAYLPVLKPRNYDEIDPENHMEIDLLWKFAQARVWKVDRRLRVSVRKRDLEDMIKGYIEGPKHALGA